MSDFIKKIMQRIFTQTKNTPTMYAIIRDIDAWEVYRNNELIARFKFELYQNRMTAWSDACNNVRQAVNDEIWFN